ncbi:MAG: immunoglobulin-like domain-containing protein, partial [Dehalobacterium sp.]
MAFAAAPMIESAAMDSLLSDNYIRVPVSFSEGIYADADGTGVVSKDDFDLTVNSNEGAVTDATINSIRTTGNNDPIPGTQNFFFYINLAGGPPSGTETITIKPTVGGSVYNENGEAMAADASAVFTLLDKRVKLAPDYPKVGVPQAAGSKQVQLVVKPLNETVTAYYVIVADGAAAPSAAQVMAGQDSAGQMALAAGSQEADTVSDTNFTATLLADATDYDAYVVIKDTANNGTAPVKVDVRTPDASVSGNVCEIGPTGYASLETALIAAFNAEGSQTIKLLQPIEVTAPIIVDGRDITFDLDGYDLTVDTSATSNSTALKVINGGSVSLDGDDSAEFNVIGDACGVEVEGTNSSATVTNATGGIFGAHATNGEITVKQDATGTGARAMAGGKITVGDDVTGVFGAYATSSNSSITIAGDVTATGVGNVRYGVTADGLNATVTVGGNVTANDCIGAAAAGGGKVQIDGTLTAPAYYVKLGGIGASEGTIKTAEEYEQTEIEGVTKTGYRTYYDAASGSKVWVKAVADTSPTGAAVWNYRSPLPVPNNMQDVKYINGQYMAVGYNGTLITSSNGEIWQKVNVGTDTDRLTGIAYGNRKYVIVGTACDYVARIYTSDDGQTWRETAAVPHHWLYDVVYGDGQFVAVGQSGKILLSADGENWVTKTVSPMDYTLLSVTYANGKYVAAGMGTTTAKPKGGIMTSDDGENWTVRHSHTTYTLWDVTYGGGVFAAVGGRSDQSGSYYICTSTDGTTWTPRSVLGAPTSTACFYSVDYDSSRFIAAGSTTGSGTNKAYVAASDDGITWTYRGDEGKSSFRVVTSNASSSQYVVMGGTGNIYTSDNGGTSWTSRTLGTTKTLRDVAWNGSLFVSVGREGTIQTSPDGVTWTIQSSGTTNDLNKVDYLNGQFIAVGNTGAILTSSNGTAWISRASGTIADLQDIAFGEGKYVTGGNGAARISSNGISWSTPEGLITLKTVAYGNGGFVALSQYGEAFNSDDGVNWTNCGRLYQYSKYPTDMIYAGGKFVAVGGYGEIYLSSDNGKEWTTIESDLRNYYLQAVTYGGGHFAAVAQGGNIIASANGETWFMQPSGLTPNPYYSQDDDAELYGIVAGGDSFVAVGGNGVVLQSEDFGICTDPEAHDVAVAKAKLGFYDISGPGANENAGRIVMGMNLITSGANGTAISWASSKPGYIATDGTVIRPSFGTGNQVVYLTATITKGSASDTKTFIVVVIEQSDPDIQIVEQAVAALTFGVIKESNIAENNIMSNLNLITEGDNGTTISWTSNKPGYIATDGTVTRPAEGAGDQAVTLTATISKGAVSRTRNFYLTVKAQLSPDARDVADAKAALTFEVIKEDNTVQNNIKFNLNLISSGDNGTEIEWSSSNPTYIAADGTVTRPAQGAADVTVTLTATITKGSASDTKTFNLTVKAKSVIDVTGIAVTAQPSDLTYTAGQSLSLDGLVVTLTYNDESTLEVGYEDFIYMDITADPDDGAALSVTEHHDKPVTVTCNGQTAYTDHLTVTASADRWVSGIAIKTQPTDLTYTAGQSLSLDGLVVTLTYNDGSTLEMGYEDFIYMDITANPAHGTTMAVATHHNRPVTVTCNGQTAATNNLTVTSGSSGGHSGGSSGNPSAPAPAVNAVVAAGNTPETTLPVSVSNGSGTVSLEASIAGALFGGEGTALVTIPSIAGVRNYTLEMPAFTLSGSQGGEALTLSAEAGSITLPGNMLLGSLEAEAQKVGITLGQGDKSLLPEDVKEALGDRPLIRLSLTVDGQQTSWSNENAPVTVSIPYTPTPQELANPESIVIWYIDGSGNTVSISNGRYDPATGTVTFATTHFSYYAVGYNQVSFKDVAADAWYGEAVAFIAAREITIGAGNDNFNPEEKLTRGQFIVMLMKAYGMVPDVNPKDNFADAGNTYYTGYLAAAKRLGISAGVGNNLFVPDKEITRQEMFTLLYNGLKA